MSVVLGLVVPGLPHPLLAPQASPHWAAIRAAYDRAARLVQRAVDEQGADLLVLYSTQWVSVIGHQVQADPEPVWTHVDPEFHALGSMPYRLRMDAAYAEAYAAAAQARGLACRTVAYKGFPIDTGTVVALSLLDPQRRLGATTTSCNMYADRGETVVLGKAARDAIEAGGRRAIVVAVTSLSARQHVRAVAPEADHIASPKDEEWNRKLLEILGEGRLEDVSQLARTVAHQAHADSKMKAFWWLSAVMDQGNRLRGEVLGYGPIWGTGAAVVALTPAETAQGQHEFDEDGVDRYAGDHEVLDPVAAQPLAAQAPPPAPVRPAPAPAVPAPVRSALADQRIDVAGAPRPVGAYPHARRVGDLLYLSGIGPRDPQTDQIPGGPIRDAEGRPQAYDIRAQTRACIDNVRRVLEASGSSLDRVLDVTAFLVDMDRDFAGYNEIYGQHFASVGATRTTLAVRALPTPIAVELKVIAAAGRG